jgi:hypothetical protein
MSTQNAKRMTTWMGFRCTGHSHGQPFRQHTAHRTLVSLHLPTGFTDAVAHGETGGKEQLRRGVSLDMPASAIRTRRL